FQNAKPWEAVKKDKAQAHADCTFVVNVCKALTVVIKPTLPELAAATEKMLGIGPVDFSSPLFDLGQGHALGPTARLIERLDKAPLDKIVEASKVETAPVATAAPTKQEITYDQFDLVDLRAGKIVSAERVPKSEKLLQLKVDLGETEARQVIAGIGLAYAPEQVVGKVV